MDVSILYHPVFQSVVLPLLLSLVGIALMRRSFGTAWAAAAVGLSVLASAIWLMGWSGQPDSLMQKLPWIFAGAWIVGSVLGVTGGSRRTEWLVLGAAWLLASWWLGSRGAGLAAAAAVAGIAVIGALVHSVDSRADGAAASVIAALGLAALAFLAGSLAIFQLGLLLAAALGGAGLWLWPKARVRFGPAATAVAALGWLALAQASMVLIPVRLDSVALIAAAFAAPFITTRFWPAGRETAAPLTVAVLAGALVAGALWLQAGVPQAARTDGGSSIGGSGAGDDAYYGR
jgi:uncharacterized membrane protein